MEVEKEELESKPNTKKRSRTKTKKFQSHGPPRIGHRKDLATRNNSKTKGATLTRGARAQACGWRSCRKDCRRDLRSGFKEGRARWTQQWHSTH